MKIGIDLCEFTSVHAGGKDEVAYNLLRGFEQLGYSRNIVCFCTKELVSVIRQISKDVEICVVPKVKIEKRWIGVITDVLFKWVQGFSIRKAMKKQEKYRVDLLLFTNKLSPWIKFPVKTVIIPHDIQVFLLGKVPGLPPLKRMKVFQLFIKLDFFCRDHIIAISEYDKAEMIRFMPWAKKKIRRIYNPIRFKEQKQEKRVKKYITGLNIQWAHKNIITLLRAYAKIMDQTEYDLILVGRKLAAVEEMQKVIAENHMEDRVHFTGYVSQEELDRITAETRIYVNPSFFEGFGMTAVEMMGGCVPTIVADTTAMPETTLGLCRYYGPADDADALARVLLEELENPVSQEQLQEISEKIRNTYSYLNIAEEYWGFMEEIVTGGKKKGNRCCV